jgi:hypothetical protein
MKLFVLYILASFLIGVLIWRRSASARTRIIASMSLLVCIGYLFLRQI